MPTSVELYLNSVKENNFNEIKKYFSEGGNPNTQDNNGYCALTIFAQGKTNFDLLDLLLENGCDPNFKAENGLYPLTAAMTFYTGRDDETTILTFANKLYEAGLDLKCCDENSNTFLHEAAYYDLPKTTEFLLEKGADVNAKEKDGNTPIINAILSYSQESLDVLKCFIGDPEIEDWAGKTLLFHAIEHDHEDIIRILLEKNVNLNHQTRFDKETALMVAAKNKKREIMDLLIEAGANESLKNSAGKTAEELFNEV